MGDEEGSFFLGGDQEVRGDGKLWSGCKINQHSLYKYNNNKNCFHGYKIKTGTFDLFDVFNEYLQ